MGLNKELLKFPIKILGPYVLVGAIPVFIASAYPGWITGGDNSYLLYVSIVFVISYLIAFTVTLKWLYEYFKDDIENLWLLPAVYIVMVIVCSFPFYMMFDWLELLFVVDTYGHKERYSGFDVYYYLIISFTSVGYGDISPIENSGKLLAIVLSLIGNAFSATFIVLVLEKFDDKNKASRIRKVVNEGLRETVKHEVRQTIKEEFAKVSQATNKSSWWQWFRR